MEWVTKPAHEAEQKYYAIECSRHANRLELNSCKCVSGCDPDGESPCAHCVRRRELADQLVELNARGKIMQAARKEGNRAGKTDDAMVIVVRCGD